MQKKQCKIRVENGEIKFLDPIDLDEFRDKEGLVIFFDEKDVSCDTVPLLKMIGSIDEEIIPGGTTSEKIDSEIYNEP